MNTCQFQNDRCTRCGTIRQPPYPVRRCRPGLGDRVASALDTVGITKPRAAAVARALGAKRCRCAARQAWLNQLGDNLGNLGNLASLTNKTHSGTIHQ